MSMVPMEVVAEPGAPVIVVKRAGPGPDAAQLAHEAEVLDAVRGPGVVELLGFDADDDGAELRMAWAGHHTLATIGRIPVLAAADLVANGGRDGGETPRPPGGPHPADRRPRRARARPASAAVRLQPHVSR